MFLLIFPGYSPFLDHRKYGITRRMAAATIDADEAEPVELEDDYSPILFVEYKGLKLNAWSSWTILTFCTRKIRSLRHG
jgi:hypothetical protein